MKKAIFILLFLFLIFPASASTVDFDANVTSGSIPLSIEFIDDTYYSTNTMTNYNFETGYPTEISSLNLVHYRVTGEYSKSGVYSLRCRATSTGSVYVTYDVGSLSPDTETLGSAYVYCTKDTYVQYPYIKENGGSYRVVDGMNQGLKFIPAYTWTLVSTTGTTQSDWFAGTSYMTLRGAYLANGTPDITTTIYWDMVQCVSPYSVQWDFGDGNTSTEENPVYTYVSDGVYDVKLHDISGSSWGNKTDYIRTAASTPSLTSPTNGTSYGSAYPDYNDVTLEWDGGATVYYGVISTSPSFSPVWYSDTLYTDEWEVTLDSGTYYWKITAYDTVNDNYSDQATGYFIIGAASSESGYVGILCENEETGDSINNFSVELYNSTDKLSKSTTNGTIYFTSAEVIAGEYVAKVYETNNSARWRVIDSPDNITVYLPGSDTDLVFDAFSIIDYTGYFKYYETRLIISNPSTGIVNDNYFDSSGLCKVYLIQDQYYSLSLICGDYEKTISPYIPAESESVSLVVGDIELVPASELYGGFNWNLTKTDNNVTFTWIAPAGCLNEPFNYTIYDTGDNDTVVHSLISATPYGTSKYDYADNSTLYKIVLSVNTTGGLYYHTEYVSGSAPLVDLGISELWYNMISIFVLFVIGLTFGARSASAGAFITALCAGGLYMFNFLRIDLLIISMVVILGIVAVLRGRS